MGFQVSGRVSKGFPRVSARVERVSAPGPSQKMLRFTAWSRAGNPTKWTLYNITRENHMKKQLSPQGENHSRILPAPVFTRLRCILSRILPVPFALPLHVLAILFGAHASVCFVQTAMTSASGR